MVSTAQSAAVDVRLLGGVDVVIGDRRVPLGGAKPRALFAMLAMQPDTVVSADRLVDAVWGEAAPQSVRSSLQVHVSNVRRSLATAGAGVLVETRLGGYVFVAGSSVVDVHRFADLARVARQAFDNGDLTAAHASARDARALWRGPPLAGIGDIPYAAAVVTSLELQWLELLELAADVEIALGRPADVVPDLERVVAENPYRETSWSRLALALYLSGRQVDALNRIATLRRILAEELGLDPSPDIAALEVAILNQDPALSGGQRSHHTPAIRSRLPAVRPLIGREQLITDLASTLESERLVTLVGPGGVGKTSAAVSCAARITAEPGTTGMFVDLSVVDASAAMLPSILADLGVRTFDPDAAEDDLIGLLGDEDRPMLVIDNCEHLIEHVARLTQHLVERCPRLRVLATSREPLGLATETVVVCSPLSPADATELFLVRAQAADRNYAASDEELAAIHEMAVRLDGLPLGIELFAARVRTSSVVEMVGGLDDDALLRTSRRDTTARHRSLHDAVAWSYQLLGAGEQLCLRRMSVFGGSANLAAITEVCQLSRTADLETLVARSLVVAERAETGVRYRLPVTVRAFAANLLAESGEHSTVRGLLVSHTVDWARKLRVDLEGPNPARALTDLACNAANLRIAHDAAVDHFDNKTAAALTAAFGPYGLAFSGALPELDSWVRDGLAAGDADPGDRLVLLLIAAHNLVETDEFLQTLADEALNLATELDNHEAALLAAVIVAETRLMTDIEASLIMAQRAISLASRSSQSLPLALAIGVATTAAIRTRRFDEARSMIDAACALGTTRFGGLQACVLFHKGRISMLTGDLDHASESFQAAGEAARRTLSVQGQSYALFGRAEVDLRLGNTAAALLGYRQSLAMTLMADRHEVGQDRMMVARVASAAGELELAEHQVDALRHDGRALSDEASYLAAAGHLASARGHTDTAKDHFIAAIRLFAQFYLWDVVADLLDSLARCTDSDGERQRFADAAAGLYAGTVSLADVLELVEEP